MIDDQLLYELAEATSLAFDYLNTEAVSLALEYFNTPSNALGIWIIATGVILGAFLLTPFIHP